MRRAGNRVRTDDLLITNQLLYQLSYAGFVKKCEWDHILAVSATLCFQILNVAIHNRPSRRTNAERDPIQGGFVPKPHVRSVPAWIRVWSVGKRLLSVLVPPGFVQTDSNPAHLVAENLFALNSPCSA